MSTLVINSGSSSLKLSLFIAKTKGGQLDYEPDWEDDKDVDWSNEDDKQLEQAIEQSLSTIPRAGGDLKSVKQEIVEVGHRIVHGGPDYFEPTVVDDAVVQRLDELKEYAPLHNPINVRALKAARNILPQSKHIAIFDTAFHRTLPPKCHVYPVPYQWYEEYNIRKYGFHGINHQYCSTRVIKMVSAPKAERIITCHLGGGCSVAAIAAGKSIETSMGFTPLEGLMMSSRSGSIDAGILFYLYNEKKIGVEDLDTALNKNSGIKGIYEKSGDFKELLEAMKADDRRGKLAFEMFIHRVCAGIGQMAAALNGVDVLVFSGGIGEHSKEVRLAVCEQLAYLGVKIDSSKNDAKPIDCSINAQQSRIPVFVLKAREDWQIATECTAINY